MDADQNIDRRSAGELRTMPLSEALQRWDLPHLERNLFSSPDWMHVLRQTYGVRLFVKLIALGDRVRSYIIYSVVNNFLEEKICVSSYCDYCDCPVASREDWTAFVRSWQNDYPRYRIAIRSLRDEHVRVVPGLQLLYTEMFHALDVRDDTERIWKRTNDSFRSAVQQARHRGVRIRPCRKSELRNFYELHLKIRKYKYRVFPQPYRFFQNIWARFMERDKGILLGAFSPEGKFIGGNIYLICGDTLYYKFNTSDMSALHFRPNNILFWEGIRFAKERGLVTIDLGSSGLDQKGLIGFKDHTGATSSLIHHLGYAPDHYRFSRKRILKFLTNTLTVRWMPDVVLKMGSDFIYHYLA